MKASTAGFLALATALAVMIIYLMVNDGQGLSPSAFESSWDGEGDKPTRVLSGIEPPGELPTGSSRGIAGGPSEGNDSYDFKPNRPKRTWFVQGLIKGDLVGDGLGRAWITYDAPFVFGPEDTISVLFTSGSFEIDFTELIERPRPSARQFSSGPLILGVDHPSILPVTVVIDLATAVVTREGFGVERHVIVSELQVKSGSRIVGRVTSQGNSVQNAWVLAVTVASPHELISDGVSGSDGEFSLAVPSSSELLLVAGHPGLRPAVRELHVTQAGPYRVGEIEVGTNLSITGYVEVTSKADPPGVVIAMPQLEGRVTSYPRVPSFLIWNKLQPEYSSITVPVGKTGAFSLGGLGPYPYDLEFVKKASHQVCSFGDSRSILTVRPPLAGVQLLDDTAPRVELSVHSKGLPLVGAEVTATHDVDGESATISCKTDAAGVVHFALVDDGHSYRFLVSRVGYESRAFSISAAGSGDVIREEVELRPVQIGTIKLIVRSDGGPQARVGFDLKSLNDSVSAYSGQAFMGPEQGQYLIPDVPAGAYTLQVTAAGPWNSYASTLLPLERECIVRANEVTVIEGSMEVGGQLRLSTLPAAANVGCRILSAGKERQSISFVSTAGGVFYESADALGPEGRALVVPALPSGSYTVWVEDPRYAPDPVKCVIAPGDTVDVLIDLKPR